MGKSINFFFVERLFSIARSPEVYKITIDNQYHNINIVTKDKCKEIAF